MAKVAIIMGSDSDLPIMKDAADFLKKMSVPFEITVISAHRTPERMVEFMNSAPSNDIKVFIAAAGGAAHLPGVAAAMTALPVIGVPIKSAALSGVDSLYSIVSMPPGVPVATVAVNGAKNAAILACQILAVSDETMLRRMQDYKSELKNAVTAKAEALEQKGYDKYLEEMTSNRSNL